MRQRTSNNHTNIPDQDAIEAVFRLLRRADCLRSELQTTSFSLGQLAAADMNLNGMLVAWFETGGATSEDFVAWLSAGCPGAKPPVPSRGGFRLVVENGEGLMGNALSVILTA